MWGPWPGEVDRAFDHMRAMKAISAAGALCFCHAGFGGSSEDCGSVLESVVVKLQPGLGSGHAVWLQRTGRPDQGPV